MENPVAKSDPSEAELDAQLMARLARSMSVLPVADPIDLLDADGFMKLLPAADLDAFPPGALRQWAHWHGRYHLPTVESVAWLRDFVAERAAMPAVREHWMSERAVEIGAGAGDLSHHLDITATDNFCQRDPKVALFYASLGQPTVPYGRNVMYAEALDAINIYDPLVVIGAWVTHWIDPDLPPPPGGGCVYGPKEDEILATGIPYVFIGNLKTHASKPILQRPHRQVKLDGLRSRGDPELDRIFIFNE